MRITPSILNADFANLAGEIAKIPDADAIHVDVMDNHFVPNLSIGLPVVESIRRATDAMLDIHLMIADPDRWAPAYAEAGAQSVTFHIEAAREPVTLARNLRAQGARAGMAIKPGTEFAPYEELLPDLDMVLVMTVEPGFGGQKFLDNQMAKVRRLRDEITRRGLKTKIQVDGGVSPKTAHIVAEAGADVLVAGSAVYGAENPAEAIDSIREKAEAAFKA